MSHPQTIQRDDPDMSQLIYRQLTNGRAALIHAGLGPRKSEDIMRFTLCRWLADEAVGALDGAQAERMLIELAIDEAFTRRGIKNPPPQKILPPPTRAIMADWNFALGVLCGVMLCVTVAALALQ